MPERLSHTVSVTGAAPIDRIGIGLKTVSSHRRRLGEVLKEGGGGGGGLSAQH